MECNKIQVIDFPDYATLHPGYELQVESRTEDYLFSISSILPSIAG
jgi:hypothetical protein